MNPEDNPADESPEQGGEIPLAPPDEELASRQHELMRKMVEEHAELLAELSGPPPVPLEHREDLSPADLEHFVVNYVLDLMHHQRERAQRHVMQLRRFGAMGRQTVAAFREGEVKEPALSSIPDKLLNKLLTQLEEHLSTKRE